RSRSRDRRRQDKGRDDEAAAAAAAADMAEEERQRDLDEDEEERRRLAEQETKMARTVMLTSLTHRSDERDIYEFFSTGAGTVRDVQIIRDARTGRSRGVAYVEMSTGEGMVRAIGLSGQSLKVLLNCAVLVWLLYKGQAIRVQQAQADGGRSTAASQGAYR
ncbi:unnamed protein product, partial [Prorocentrum cordatum]